MSDKPDVVFQALSIAVRDICLDCVIKYPAVPKFITNTILLGSCDNCQEYKNLALIRDN